MTQHMNPFVHQNVQGKKIPQIQFNTIGTHIPTYASHIHTRQKIPTQNVQHQQIPTQNVQYTQHQYIPNQNIPSQ